VIEKEKQKKRGYAQPLFLHFLVTGMAGVVANINPLLVRQLRCLYAIRYWRMACLMGAGPHDKVL
jgi:hypothetical protein